VNVSPIDVIARSDHFEAAAAGVQLRPWEWAFIHAVDGRMQVQEVAALCDLELPVAQGIVVEQTAAGLLRVVTMTLEDYRRWSGFEPQYAGAVAQAAPAVAEPPAATNYVLPPDEASSTAPGRHGLPAPAEEAVAADGPAHVESPPVEAPPVEALQAEAAHAEPAYTEPAHAEATPAETQPAAVEHPPAALADPGTIPEPLAFPDHFARPRPVALDLDVLPASFDAAPEAAAPQTPATDRFATESFLTESLAVEPPAADSVESDPFAREGAPPDRFAPERSSRDTYVAESFGHERFASEPLASEPFSPEPYTSEPFAAEPFARESEPVSSAAAGEPVPASKGVSFSFDSFDDLETLEPAVESRPYEGERPRASVPDAPSEGISLSFEPGDIAEPLPADPLPPAPAFSSGSVSLSFDSSNALDAHAAPARDFDAPPAAPARSPEPAVSADQGGGTPINLSFSPDGFPILSPSLSSIPAPSAPSMPAAAAPPAAESVAEAPPPVAAPDPLPAPRAATPPPANPGAPRHAASDPDIVGSLIARVLSIRIK
jgi:hypothetical protein